MNRHSRREGYFKAEAGRTCFLRRRGRMNRARNCGCLGGGAGGGGGGKRSRGHRVHNNTWHREWREGGRRTRWPVTRCARDSCKPAAPCGAAAADRPCGLGRRGTRPGTRAHAHHAGLEDARRLAACAEAMPEMSMVCRQNTWLSIELPVLGNESRRRQRTKRAKRGCTSGPFGAVCVSQFITSSKAIREARCTVHASVHRSEASESAFPLISPPFAAKGGA